MVNFFRWYPLLIKMVGGGMWSLLGALAVLVSSCTTGHAIVPSAVIVLLRSGLPYLGSWECALGNLPPAHFLPISRRS